MIYSLVEPAPNRSTCNLWEIRIDGRTGEPGLTPDGAWVLYHTGLTPGSTPVVQIMRVPITGGPPQWVLTTRCPQEPSVRLLSEVPMVSSSSSRFSTPGKAGAVSSPDLISMIPKLTTMPTALIFLPRATVWRC